MWKRSGWSGDYDLDDFNCAMRSRWTLAAVRRKESRSPGTGILLGMLVSGGSRLEGMGRCIGDEGVANWMGMGCFGSCHDLVVLTLWILFGTAKGSELK